MAWKPNWRRGRKLTPAFPVMFKMLIRAILKRLHTARRTLTGNNQTRGRNFETLAQNSTICATILTAARLPGTTFRSSSPRFERRLESKSLESREISQVADESSSQLARSREAYVATSMQLSQHKDQVESLSKTVRELEYLLHNEVHT